MPRYGPRRKRVGRPLEDSHQGMQGELHKRVTKPLKKPIFAHVLIDTLALPCYIILWCIARCAM